MTLYTGIIYSINKRLNIFNNEDIVVSGDFDPIHSGHISYLKSAKEILEINLIVALNSDEWLN